MNSVNRIIWCVFLLPWGLVHAQTSSSNQRWPFQAPPAVSASGGQNSADSSVAETYLNPNPMVLGVSQIMEGALSSDTYIVGPGDGFIISIWGKRNERFPTTVTPEGKVLIPQIGEIQAAGLTIRQLQERLQAEISKFVYNNRVDVTLTQLRSFLVYVLGEVNRPGPYPARLVDRVSQLVTRAGGLRSGGSSRAVQIQRNGRVVNTADLTLFAQTASLSTNPYVREGDVVYVRPQTASVTIAGAVWTPGEYELLDGDTIATLVRLAKGVRPEAYLDQVELVRFNDDHRTITRTTIDLRDSTGTAWGLTLQSDDRLFVRTIPNFHERKAVRVMGEVTFPGGYAIQDSTTLTEVVTRAGGFTDEASLFEAYVLREDTTVTVDKEFERLKLTPVIDMTPTEYEYFKMKARERPGVMVVDFRRLFVDHDLTQNIKIKPNDQVIIAKNRETINLRGQVASPGAVMYNPTWGVKEYIAQAGGYAWDARKNKTRVIRAKTGEWVWADRVKELRPGDTIWVPEQPRHEWGKGVLQGITVIAQLASIYLVIITAIRR